MHKSTLDNTGSPMTGDSAAAQKKAPVVVSVINLKGGVGKTTVTALMALYAVEYMGLKTLAVDLDPQANLSQALMSTWEYDAIMGTPPAPGIVELFDGEASLAKVGRTIQRWRYKADDPHHLIPSRFGFADNLIKPIDRDERVLAKFIAKEMSHKDLVLIDCAPTESILTRAAYHASTHILIPAKPEMYSTIGFPLLQQSLDDFREGLSEKERDKIRGCWVLINKGGTMGVASEEARADILAMAKENEWQVLSHEMRHLTGYQKWMMDGAKHLGSFWDNFVPIAKEFLGELFPERDSE